MTKRLWILLLTAAGMLTTECYAAETKPPRLRAAMLRFGVTPATGGPTASRTGATVREVCGPLKTTVCLFEDGDRRLCLAASDFEYAHFPCRVTL